MSGSCGLARRRWQAKKLHSYSVHGATGCIVRSLSFTECTATSVVLVLHNKPLPVVDERLAEGSDKRDDDVCCRGVV